MNSITEIKAEYNELLDKAKGNNTNTDEGNKSLFSLYEDMLLILCRNNNVGYETIAECFKTDPLCNERSAGCLRGRYSRVKQKYANIINEPDKVFSALQKEACHDKISNSLHDLFIQDDTNAVEADPTPEAVSDSNTEQKKLFDDLFVADAYDAAISRKTIMNPYLEKLGVSPREIEMLETVLNSNDNMHSHNLTTIAGAPQFSYYENILLLVLRRHMLDYETIKVVFDADANCRNRSLNALASRYKRLKRHLGARMSKTWDYILPVVCPKIDPDEPEYYSEKTDDVTENKAEEIGEISEFGKIVLDYIVSEGEKISGNAYIKTSNEYSDYEKVYRYNDYETVYLYFAVKAGLNNFDIAQRFADMDLVCTARTPKSIAEKIEACEADDWLTAKTIVKNVLRDMQGDEDNTRRTQAAAGNRRPETAQDCELPRYPHSYVRNVDYGEPQPTDKKIKPEYPLGAILADRMNMSDTLAKAKFAEKKKYYATVQSLFAILKRNNFARMNKAARISDLAFFWHCAEAEVVERIDTFISRGVPVTREGDLVRLIQDYDNVRGGIQLHKVEAPVVDLGNGASVVRLGVVSDTHYGSPMCEEGLIERFYEIAYDAGVRMFVHAGDLFDGEGVYKGQDFEITCKGFDKNLLHVADIYPKYPDAVTYAIVGNHDHSYITKTGANPIFHLASIRNDIKYLGIYQANLYVNDEFYINLHHGAAGCTRMAPEAYLRRIINDKQEFLQAVGADKYDLCVLGHFHIDAEVTTPFCRKGIFGGGWQNTTAFTRRLNMPPYIGGYIVNMYKLPDGEHHITVEKIAFNTDESLYSVA